MNQHNFCITITWFFYLLTKYELICIRETCIGVEKYICAVTLILAYYSWIWSFIHLFIPHVQYTCRVQRQSARTHGKQTQIQMELSCYLFQSLITIFSHVFSGQNVYQPEQLIILSRHRSSSWGWYCHICNILKWAEVPFLLFLLKSFSQKLICFVLLSIHITIQSNHRI